MNANSFYEMLKKNGADLFCGVPDSLLKDFCACVTDNTSFEQNIITANEGNALALAAGHYLATGKPAVVYMQNSGLGNVVNPLLSLTDEDVYNIPVLLIIGWRGEPGIHDEPQHVKQGRLTLPLLEVMEIKYEILENLSQVDSAFDYMQKTNKPFAFVVKKGTFEPFPKQKNEAHFNLSREDAIKQVVSLLKNTDVVVSTTGMISRELYENRSSHEKDFLTVGSMGHASSIALGIALSKTERKVFCFDGDGAFLMHMGAVPVIASRHLTNFKHIMFNNEAHDSVGGQPTVMGSVNVADVVYGCGYKHVYQARTVDDITQIWSDFYASDGPSLLEIKVKSGARKDLGRPKEKPVENKKMFMNFIKG